MPNHLILIPAYNAGRQLLGTVRSALEKHPHVWVVDDASTDGCATDLPAMPGLRVLTLPENSGKGGAVLLGMKAAAAESFTHALVMDSDGQHPAEKIPLFLETSRKNPDAMILGVPQFGPDAPKERIHGRKIGNWFSHLETLWDGVEDSLFGFRVYPIAPSVHILESIRTARRFDFDTELAVRLHWAGIPSINLPAPVCYPPVQQGGVTHFRYLRDNLLLIGTHTRLVLGMVLRLPHLLIRKCRPHQTNDPSRLPH